MNEQIQTVKTVKTGDEELTVSFSRARRFASRLNSLTPGVLAKISAVPAVGFSVLAAHEAFTDPATWSSAEQSIRFGGPASIALMGIATVVAARSEYRHIRQDVVQSNETMHA